MWQNLCFKVCTTYFKHDTATSHLLEAPLKATSDTAWPSSASQRGGGTFPTKRRKLPECHMTTQKVPQLSSSVLTLWCMIAACPTGYFWWAQAHTHTPVEAYSPDEGDHLLHNVPAEGDDHKQFLYDKERHRKSESVTEPWGHCWGSEQGSKCIIVWSVIP